LNSCDEQIDSREVKKPFISTLFLSNEKNVNFELLKKLFCNEVSSRNNIKYASLCDKLKVKIRTLF